MFLGAPRALDVEKKLVCCCGIDDNAEVRVVGEDEGADKFAWERFTLFNEEPGRPDDGRRLDVRNIDSEVFMKDLK